MKLFLLFMYSGSCEHLEGAVEIVQGKWYYHKRGNLNTTAISSLSSSHSYEIIHDGGELIYKQGKSRGVLEQLRHACWYTKIREESITLFLIDGRMRGECVSDGDVGVPFVTDAICPEAEVKIAGQW